MAEREHPGSPLGDEAARLVGAVQNWARQTFPEPADGHTGSECQWCPLCQFLAVLRGERPEVTERVAEAGTALASAFRAVVDSATSGLGRRGGEDAGAPRVQRIDLGKSDE